MIPSLSETDLNTPHTPDMAGKLVPNKIQLIRGYRKPSPISHVPVTV